MEVSYDNACFCCGKDNDSGLKLEFLYPEEGVAESHATVPEHFTGWQNITHGGFLSMLLDEVMAHACVSAGKHMVTAALNIRYKKPAAVGSTLYLKGKITNMRGRLATTSGQISDEDGEVVAAATGTFLAPPE